MVHVETELIGSQESRATPVPVQGQINACIWECRGVKDRVQQKIPGENAGHKHNEDAHIGASFCSHRERWHLGVIIIVVAMFPMCTMRTMSRMIVIMRIMAMSCIRNARAWRTWAARQ